MPLSDIILGSVLLSALCFGITNMNENHRRRITSNLVDLTKDLTYDDIFSSGLIEKEIFTNNLDEMVKVSFHAFIEKFLKLYFLISLQSKLTSTERNFFFWNQIQKRGPKAWEGLIYALVISTQTHISHKLDPVLSKSIYLESFPGEKYPEEDSDDSSRAGLPNNSPLAPE